MIVFRGSEQEELLLFNRNDNIFPILYKSDCNEGLAPVCNSGAEYSFVPNPDYPQNYINDIVDNLGKYKFIFITLARELFAELDKLGIEYTILYPLPTRKQKILDDARKRGNNEHFVGILDKILSSNEEHDFLKNNCNYKEFIYLPDDEYVTDYINRMYPNEK